MHNKQAFSYGNHCGKDINVWRMFIKQCYGASLVRFQLNPDKEGKGSHTLPVVRKCLIDSENWLSVETKRDYHFPGVFATQHLQQLYYIEDVNILEQNWDEPHFIWKDIQLSKGQLNKSRLITAEIAGKMEEVYYRSAPCLGIKQCPHESCNYAVSIREKDNAQLMV